MLFNYNVHSLQFKHCLELSGQSQISTVITELGFCWIIAHSNRQGSYAFQNFYAKVKMVAQKLMFQLIKAT